MTSHYNANRGELDIECDCCGRVKGIRRGDHIPVDWTRFTTRKSVTDVCPTCYGNLSDLGRETLNNAFSEPLVVTKFE